MIGRYFNYLFYVKFPILSLWHRSIIKKVQTNIYYFSDYIYWSDPPVRVALCRKHMCKSTESPTMNWLVFVGALAPDYIQKVNTA